VAAADKTGVDPDVSVIVFDAVTPSTFLAVTVNGMALR
jgi:hypothetical protein